MRLTVTVDGVDYEVLVDVEPEPRPALGGFVFSSTGAPNRTAGGVTAPPAAENSAAGGGENALRAPIAGTVLQVSVQPGQEVNEGDSVIILEAMKMETEVTAPVSGTVKAVPVKVGMAVQSGDLLVEFE
ncbi:MAG: biotin/lipoyl-containing protein [Dermatophilaceae bacterium]